MEVIIGAALIIIAIYIFVKVILPILVMAFGAIFALICLITAVLVIPCYFKALKKNVHIINYEWEKGIEPAKRSYFFGPGYNQLKGTIKDGFAFSKATAKGIKNKIIEQTGDESFLGFLGMVIGVGVDITYNIIGGVISIGCILIHGGITLIVMCIIYIIFGIVWLIDRLYLLIKKIKNDCAVCHEPFMIPVYACPDCGAKHRNLVPGAYGIFSHRCNCGTSLPSTFLGGRSKLDAYCPFCDSKLIASDTRSVIIQLGGGSSSGKTVFLSSFFHEYIEKLNSNSNIEISIDIDDQYKFDELNMYYSGILPDATTEMNSQMYPIIVSGKNINPRRKFAIYDIGGEMFNPDVNSNEIIQKQFGYCNGMVLLIDPFSSITLRQEAKASGYNISNYNEMDADEIVTNFINYLVSIDAIKIKHKTNKPLSVVISKSDVKIIKQKIGITKINSLYKKEDSQEVNYDDFRDNMIKEFLNDYDMGNAISILENQFSNIHYFVASAIGHEPNGSEFTPFGVQQCIDWIIRETDRSYYNAIDEISE